MGRVALAAGLLLSGLAFLALPCLVYGQHGAGGESAKTEHARFIATVHGPKGEEERKFDLSKEHDAEELSQLLRKGEISEMRRDEPPDLLAIKWDLGLWTLVVFGLLILILRRVAWGPMLEGLKKREASIREAIDEAKRAREDAERLRLQFQSEMDKASDKVRALLDEARKEAQQAQDAMLAKARTEIQTERDRLRREIELAKDQALQELWHRTAQLAAQVSSKAIRRQLTTEYHRRLVDEAIAELREAGKKDGSVQ